MAALYRKRKPYFDYGLLVKDSFDVLPSMTMSAYDSKDPSATDLRFESGTLNTASSSVNIRVGTVVNGDLFCGVGGDPSSAIKVAGTLNGKTYALTEEPEGVEPAIPASLPNKGKNISVKGGTITITPADSGVYSTINIDTAENKPGKLIVDGGTVTLGVKESMSLSNNAEIVVKEGSTLIIYVGGNVSSGTSASISYAGTVKDPTHIQIYGTSKGSKSWDINAKNDFVGVIYAPNANLKVHAEGNIYGAVMADKAVFLSITGYYYDVNLQRATNIALSGPGSYVTKRWSESTVGEVPDWAY
ncbi:MAG: hypothetical protein ABII09_12650 [Planctomycetota bacterium]